MITIIPLILMFKCVELCFNSRIRGRLHCMFAFLIASHRNPAIDCCKGLSIFKWDSALSDVCAKYHEVNDVRSPVRVHNLSYHVESRITPIM